MQKCGFSILSLGVAQFVERRQLEPGRVSARSLVHVVAQRENKDEKPLDRVRRRQLARRIANGVRLRLRHQKALRETLSERN